MPLSEVEGPRLPRFDWTINFGHLLVIGTVLTALATTYTTYQVTINDHDTRLRALEKQTVNLDGRTSEIYKLLYEMKQELAIINYKLEPKSTSQK